MLSTQPNSIEKTLKLDFADSKTIWLTAQQTLRRLIGILGIALPVLLVIGLIIARSYYIPLASISHYYYTRVSSVFVIIISILAIFLLVYKGYERLDFYVSSLAGFFALCVLLFPTGNLINNCVTDHPYAVTILRVSNIRVIFHFISAGIFLLSLAFISFFIFTKSDRPGVIRTKQKRIRNRIYRVCALIMLLAILVMASSLIPIIKPSVYDHFRLTFCMETAAVWSFGISWLIKGETLFKDKPRETSRNANY